MFVLFPFHPFHVDIDPIWAEEASWAASLGFTPVACDPWVSLIAAEDFGGQKVLYRGWMLTPEDYAGLHRLVASKNGQMIVSPGQYKDAHWATGFYQRISNHLRIPMLTAAPTTEDVSRSWTISQIMGWGTPVFVKDRVKSTMASVAHTRADAWRAVDEIRRLRPNGVEGGVVLKKYIPLYDETRIFFVNREPVDNPMKVSHQRLLWTLSAVYDIIREHPFLAVDVGIRSEDGDYTVIEVGDGQVSEVKEVGFDRLYANLKNLF